METIQVSIRIRPFLSYEDETNTTIQTFEDDNRKIILAKNNKKFVSHFDRIFPQNSKQEDVYNFINPRFHERIISGVKGYLKLLPKDLIQKIEFYAKFR